MITSYIQPAKENLFKKIAHFLRRIRTIDKKTPKKIKYSLNVINFCEG